VKSLRIGFLLGLRQIQRASIWTTVLIVFVMMLTFLNLIAVSGVLVGLIEGAERAVKAEALGDIIISPRDDEDHILETESFIKQINSFAEIENYSVRYRGNAIIEANYKERRDLSGDGDTAAIQVTGIDPVLEDQMAGLSNNILEGEYLDPNEEGYILIGVYYIKEYADIYGDIFDTVEDIHPGDTVRLTAGNVSKELIVKGIVKSKVDDVSLNTYISEREFRRIFDRFDRNADEIIIRLNPDFSEDDVKASFVNMEMDKLAKIQTYDEGKPKFIADIKQTMNVLGTFIGSIGLVVASITIFIIIFINALARRRHIGILKGIGIHRNAIEIAYVFQAAFYALAGSLLGALLTYIVLIPYFEVHTIQFPFSDGVLVADPYQTFVKFIVLFVITLLAGFVPAWMIVRQNTLNAILGRK
jgi:ABC-type lipoprotein release transport system permease subunit